MPTMSICIVARPMSRLAFALCAVVALVSCDSLDAGSSNRKGNRLFRDGKFIDAAGLYENAIAKKKDDKLQYNLGLAYSKIFRVTDEPVLLAEKDDNPCTSIPGVAFTTRSVCVKNDSSEEDRAYPDCKKQEDCGKKDKVQCKSVELCTITNKQLADLTYDHLKIWIATQPPDDEVTRRDAILTAELAKLEEERDKWSAEADKHQDPTTGKYLDRAKFEEATRASTVAEVKVKAKKAEIAQKPDAILTAELAKLEQELDSARAEAEKIYQDQGNHKEKFEEATRASTAAEEKVKEKKSEVEENRLKFTMRALMTNILVDSNQHDKALAYWADELKARPSDFEAMGKLAGINLKAGNWRKAIEWYLTVGEKVPELQNKIGAYSSVGNVAWAKLRSKTLNTDESIEVADLGIGAFQKARELAPKNLQFLRIQASLFDFRALLQGVSWAAAIDRASAQDLRSLLSVQAPQAPAPTTPEAPPKKEPTKPPGSKPPEKKPAG